MNEQSFEQFVVERTGSSIKGNMKSVFSGNRKNSSSLMEDYYNSVPLFVDTDSDSDSSNEHLPQLSSIEDFYPSFCRNSISETCSIQPEEEESGSICNDKVNLNTTILDHAFKKFQCSLPKYATKAVCKYQPDQWKAMVKSIGGLDELSSDYALKLQRNVLLCGSLLSPHEVEAIDVQNKTDSQIFKNQEKSIVAYHHFETISPNMFETYLRSPVEKKVKFKPNVTVYTIEKLNSEEKSKLFYTQTELYQFRYEGYCSKLGVKTIQSQNPTPLDFFFESI